MVYRVQELERIFRMGWKELVILFAALNLLFGTMEFIKKGFVLLLFETSIVEGKIYNTDLIDGQDGVFFKYFVEYTVNDKNYNMSFIVSPQIGEKTYVSNERVKLLVSKEKPRYSIRNLNRDKGLLILVMSVTILINVVALKKILIPPLARACSSWLHCNNMWF